MSLTKIQRKVFFLCNGPCSPQSLYGSAVALEHEIRRSDVHFLMGIQNLFFVPCSWLDQKSSYSTVSFHFFWFIYFRYWHHTAGVWTQAKWPCSFLDRKACFLFCSCYWQDPGENEFTYMIFLYFTVIYPSLDEFICSQHNDQLSW